jgi:alkylation response protein AidB-like acyl-CoA dehydrogenase
MIDRPKLENIREIARNFVEEDIPLSLAREIDSADRYPADLLEKFSETGLWGVNIAEQYGGMGGDSVDAMPIYEELSRRLPVLAWVIGNIMLYGNDIISEHGSREQKDAYLPRLAEGRLRFSFALTEPDAGSDAANIQTKAVLEDGSYVITGEKLFITGAGISDVVVTLTRTDPSRYNGITAFLVDTTLPGFSTKPLKKLGYHGSNTCTVHYDRVRIAPENILGGEACLNQGWKQMVSLLNSERLALSSCSLGIGQAVLDETIAYFQNNFSPGYPGQYQATQHTIVEMATELEAARQLVAHAARMAKQGIECLRETSMAKYFSSEMAKKLALQSVDIMGSDGGALAYEAQRFLRDVLVLSIGGGTTQIQKNIIAKTLEI